MSRVAAHKILEKTQYFVPGTINQDKHMTLDAVR